MSPRSHLSEFEDIADCARKTPSPSSIDLGEFIEIPPKTAECGTQTESTLTTETGCGNILSVTDQESQVILSISTSSTETSDIPMEAPLKPNILSPGKRSSSSNFSIWAQPPSETERLLILATDISLTEGITNRCR